MINKDATLGIVAGAIHLSVARLEETHPSVPKMMHAYHFLNDYRTIRINLGRGMGHTTAIGRMFDPELDLLVVPKKYWKNFFAAEHRIPDNRIHDQTIRRNLRVGSERIIEKESIIWVDQATSLLEGDGVTELYASLVTEASHFHGDNFREHLPLVVALG